MAIPFTVSHPLGRAPTIIELQKLGQDLEIQFSGDNNAGVVSHPNAKGKYTRDQNCDLRGEIIYTRLMLVKISGAFVLTTKKAEITISQNRSPLSDTDLGSKLLEFLKVFCAKFPPAD
jgi:hypothetical protein